MRLQGKPCKALWSIQNHHAHTCRPSRVQIQETMPEQTCDVLSSSFCFNSVSLSWHLHVHTGAHRSQKQAFPRAGPTGALSANWTQVLGIEQTESSLSTNSSDVFKTKSDLLKSYAPKFFTKTMCLQYQFSQSFWWGIQPKWSKLDRFLKKMWGIYTNEYYSAM